MMVKDTMPPENNANHNIDENQSLRQQWLGVFAKSARDTLEGLLEESVGLHRFQTLRAAESGLVMVRARAGGDGELFNTGEMTVTRCSVRNAQGTVGHGYVAGRDRQHAEAVAKLDVIMQEKDKDEVKALVSALQDDQIAKSRRRQQKSASTRVDFFTIVRGED